MGDYVVEQRIEKDGMYFRLCTGKEYTVTSDQLKGMDEKALNELFAKELGDGFDPEMRSFQIDPVKGEVLEAYDKATKAEVVPTDEALP